MLNKDNFRTKMGDWFPHLECLFDNGIMDNIYTFLKAETKRGKQIAPHSDLTFRCFKETPIKAMVAAMVGLCPYHTIVGGKQVADGLLMGCSNHTDYIAPSLGQYYDAIEEEFNNGLCLPCGRTGDLTYLAYQGVLMFNSSLTTEIGTAKAHQEIWKPFTEHVINILETTVVPVIFLGVEAGKYAKNHPFHIKISHPASVLYGKEKTKWSSEGSFRLVNDILESTGKQKIQWSMEEAPF